MKRKPTISHSPFSFFLLTLALTMLGCSCQPDEEEDNAFVLKGLVRDTSGMPLSGVRVSTGSSSAMTDASGAFEFNQAKIVDGRAVIRFEKSGYFTLTRSSVEANETYVVAVLHPKGNSHISRHIKFRASDAQNLEVPAGMKVALSASSVRRANGSAYDGEVTADMLYLEPNYEHFSDMMPGGDLSALRTDNSEVQLIILWHDGCQPHRQRRQSASTEKRLPLATHLPHPRGYEKQSASLYSTLVLRRRKGNLG